MRRALLLLVLALPLSAEPKLEDLAWMAGHWFATIDHTEMEEVWLAPAGGVMPGMHRDRKVKGVMASFEFMTIAMTPDGIVFRAQPGGRPVTPFALVESGERRAVFANPEHDFPQRIIYWRDGESLCARVEGKGEDPMEWCWSRRP